MVQHRIRDIVSLSPKPGHNLTRRFRIVSLTATQITSVIELQSNGTDGTTYLGPWPYTYFQSISVLSKKEAVIQKIKFLDKKFKERKLSVPF